MSIKTTYEHMARPLGVRGHQKRSFLVASHKANREMFVESRCEHTTLLALDVDPRTVGIVPQPFTVRLDQEQIFPTKTEAFRHITAECKRTARLGLMEERLYTPDFEVELMSPASLIVESKDGKEIEKTIGLLERREQVLYNLGYRYLVVPNTDVEHKGLHNNLVNLRDAMQYRRKNDTDALMGDLSRAVQNRPSPFAFGEIRKLLPDLALYLGLVSGVIACDLRGGFFGNRTMIWPAHGDLGHLQLLPLGA